MSFENVDNFILQKSAQIAHETPDTQRKFQFNVQNGYSLNVTTILCQLFKDEMTKNIILEHLRKRMNGLTHFHEYSDAVTNIIQQAINLKTIPRINQNIIYRFTDPEYLTILNEPHLMITTRQAYDAGLLSKHELMQFKDPIFYCFIFQPAKLHIRSDIKERIDLREYVGPRRGKGGSIVGFQKYSPNELTNVYGSTEGTIYGATRAFGYNRPLFVTSSSITNILKEKGLQYRQIDIRGKYSRFQEHDSNVEISDNLNYEPDIVKIFNAGSVLPNPNLAEINVVGKFDFDGYVIRVVPYCPESNEVFNQSICNGHLYAGALELIRKFSYFNLITQYECD